MDDATPTVHPLADGSDADELVARLTAPERERTSTGLHVVVHVAEGANTGYARLADASSAGNGSQRWLKHERRGSSPGGWTEGHHPRSEQELGAWRDRNAEAIDRLLIDYSKRAWKLEGDAPYVVEFAPVAFAGA